MNDSLYGLPKRAKALRRRAEMAESTSAMEWHRAEKAKLEASGLEPDEMNTAQRALLHEFGKRLNTGLRRAKRQNTLTKLVERQIKAEIEAERKAAEE